jgi:hypothetical protein
MPRYGYLQEVGHVHRSCWAQYGYVAVNTSTRDSGSLSRPSAKIDTTAGAQCADRLRETGIAAVVDSYMAPIVPVVITIWSSTPVTYSTKHEACTPCTACLPLRNNGHFVAGSEIRNARDQIQHAGAFLLHAPSGPSSPNSMMISSACGRLGQPHTNPTTQTVSVRVTKALARGKYINPTSNASALLPGILAMGKCGPKMAAEQSTITAGLISPRNWPHLSVRLPEATANAHDGDLEFGICYPAVRTLPSCHSVARRASQCCTTHAVCELALGDGGPASRLASCCPK